MKKIIANFLLFIFCSVPRLIKAQKGVDKFNITNEEKLSHIRFADDISFTLSKDELLPPSGDKPSVKDEIKKEVSSPDDILKFSIQQIKYAMMLDVAVETIKNTRLYKFIETWYGTRYRMGGTTRKGIDCSAFTDSLLSAVYSLVIPRTAREQYKRCEHISKDDLLEGDLVFFNTRGGVSHVGVYLANGRFVHSSSSRGVMISSLSDSYFSRRFIGAGRVQSFD